MRNEYNKFHKIGRKIDVQLDGRTEEPDKTRNLWTDRQTDCDRKNRRTEGQIDNQDIRQKDIRTEGNKENRRTEE